MKLPTHLESVVRGFQRFQGVGRKTAERFVFDMISRWKREAIEEFSGALQTLCRAKECCDDCRVMMLSDDKCAFCTTERRQERVIAVVSSMKDLYSLESLKAFRGTYFIIDGLVSPIDERGVSETIIDQLCANIAKNRIEEVFLAFDGSPEGEATSFYLSDVLQKRSWDEYGLSCPKVTTFATGVPVGASLDYLDSSTLGKAFANRIML